MRDAFITLHHKCNSRGFQSYSFNTFNGVFIHIFVALENELKIQNKKMDASFNFSEASKLVSYLTAGAV